MGHAATNLAILGLQWGDEGKGKVVDLLSPHYRHVVRFQGGNNAGHTVVVDGQSIALHQVPSGALHPGCFLVVGSGVVLNLEVFQQEIDRLRDRGIDLTGRLLMSEKAHVILPHHIALDRWREMGSNPIGTTGRGIGPAYEMKTARMGVRLGDLLHPEQLRDRIHQGYEEVRIRIASTPQFPVELPSLDSIVDGLRQASAPFLPLIGDAQAHLHAAWRRGEPILFEGAQATLLDIDHGTYPFVTSSNCSLGGLFTGTGLPPQALDGVLGIAKAYTTRVGSGPMPSELQDAMGQPQRRGRPVVVPYSPLRLVRWPHHRPRLPHQRRGRPGHHEAGRAGRPGRGGPRHRLQGRGGSRFHQDPQLRPRLGRAAPRDHAHARLEDPHPGHHRPRPAAQGSPELPRRPHRDRRMPLGLPQHRAGPT